MGDRSVPSGKYCRNSLFFQYAPRLNEQAAVDGLVGHAQALVIGVLAFQPSGNLPGRPIQNQFTRNDVPHREIVVDGSGRLAGQFEVLLGGSVDTAEVVSFKYDGESVPLAVATGSRVG